MALYQKGSKGDEVSKIQEQLQEKGFYSNDVDGDFGEKTDSAVRKFQKANGLSVDGKVGSNTWSALFEKPETGEMDTPSGDILSSLSTLIEIPHSIFTVHSYKGSVGWSMGKEGVNIEGSGVERSPGEPKTARRVWDNFGDSIEKWATHFQVPSELILATICTETRGKPDAVREEPDYTSDDATPNQVSPGLMQTLISTARSALNKPDIDRQWLLVPDNSIQAGTAYIASQKSKSNFDPPKVACAYNAGGVYFQDGVGNRWKMRQYPIGSSEHADRFVTWLNDFTSLIVEGKIKISAGYFKG